MTLIQDSMKANRLLEEHPIDELLLVGLENGIVLVVTPGTSPQKAAVRTFGLLTYHPQTTLTVSAHSWLGAMHADLESYYERSGHATPGWWASEHTTTLAIADLGIGQRPRLSLVIPFDGADGAPHTPGLHTFLFDESVVSVDPV